MDYPQEFSMQACARIETERLKAERELAKAHSVRPPASLSEFLWDCLAFRVYVLRVFRAFTREACRLGRQKKWPVAYIRFKADEFLTDLAIEAYQERGHDRYGRELPELSNSGRTLLPEVKRSFQESDVWHQFEKELLEVARKQAARNGHGKAKAAAGPSTTAPNSVSAKVTAASWDQIEILFTSDERVQIWNRGRPETRNYEEFGFADRRTGKPNKAWLTLRALAQERGPLRDGSKMGQEWPKMEKRMQEIRKVFRKHFGISTDPIPFIPGEGYKPGFKIACLPAFDT